MKYQHIDGKARVIYSLPAGKVRLVSGSCNVDGDLAKQLENTKDYKNGSLKKVEEKKEEKKKVEKEVKVEEKK